MLELNFLESHASLGVSICNISLFLSAKQPVRVIIPKNNKSILFADIKRIFNISDQLLEIVEVDTVVPSVRPELNPKLGECSKFFSPYFPADTVRVMGNEYPISSKKNKKFIAIAGHNQGMHLNKTPWPHAGFPYNRYYPIEFWSKILDLILNSEYEVLSINLMDVSLEEKIFLLNEFCCAVIGYEGGICHLAHVLQIPTIMLPWNRNIHGEERDHLYYYTHRWHIDHRTYFVNNGNELLSWDKQKLDSVIDQCKRLQGNNIYYNENLTFDPATFSIVNPEIPLSGLTPWLTMWEKEFIKKYINPTSLKILRR